MAFWVVVLNVAAVWATGGHGLAIAALVGAIWSWGIASNFRGDPQNIPNYVAWLYPVCGVIGIVMLLVGLAS